MRDAVNSNLGIVRRPSLHGATLALLISKLLLVCVISTVYTAAPYALLEASANTCSSVCSYKQVKPIGFEAPRGGAYNNRKHLKLETPCS